METSTHKLLSVILLSYYSKERINKCYQDVNSLLSKEHIPFEFIIMDDGSTDESFAIALELEKMHKNVFAYQLSRNYSSNYSWLAGLSVCNGGCALAIPDDEQQPYQSIVEMYRLWEKGNQVIIPNRITRNDPFLTSLFSVCYYKIINALSEITYPKGGADLAFIDREVIDILNSRIHPINTAVIPEIFRLGFSPVYFPYERPLGLNEGKSRWSFKKKLRLAKDVFLSSSTFPIQFISGVGLFFSLISIIGIILYIYIHMFGNSLFWGVLIPGWTSIIVLILFLGGLILFSLGIIAEYIWRIYEEVKNRPGYIIKKKDMNS